MTADEAKQAPSKLVKFYITQAELMDDGTLCCRCGCEIYLPFCGYARLCGKCDKEINDDK